MGLFRKMSLSTGLVNGMSDRLDVGLIDAVIRNPEEMAQEYRAMVLRCSTCTQQDACTKLQATHDHLDHAPEYCLNKAELKAYSKA